MQMLRNLRRAQSAQNRRLLARLHERLTELLARLGAATFDLRPALLRRFAETQRTFLAEAECQASSCPIDESLQTTLNGLRRDLNIRGDAATTKRQ